MIHSRITGTGSFLPGPAVTNDDLVARGIETSDAWIFDRTGIKARHLAPADLGASDLALPAAEAALAAALEIRLGGPRSYDGTTVDLATMGNGREEVSRDDIRRGLALYDRALSLLFLGVLAGAILI